VSTKRRRRKTADVKKEIRVNKEHLFIRLEMWVEEGEDGDPCGVRYAYTLPSIDSELIIDLYSMFIESFCNELAKLSGAEKVLEFLAYGGKREE
jgi:hypothetical protein